MDHQALADLLFPCVTMTPEELEEKFPPRALPEGAVVSRMAPSPTGFVHLGNLVQGLTSERLTHQSGGVLFLRIEDTDAKREVEGAVNVLTSALKHYGIEFDEGATPDGDKGIYEPYTQSQRRDIYFVYAKKMVAEGKAYPCFCSEERIAAIREEQEKAGEDNIGYFGKWAACRDLSFDEVKAHLDAGDPWTLRYRSNGDITKKIKFVDLVKGEVELTENIMDFVLLKSDGIPTYHFAHAVDDHLMRTTHVVRGDEWLPSLPFHIQLFRDLGFRLPKYLHIGPLMKMDGVSKRKLSKRKDPELALTYYQAEGFPVEGVYEYILTILNSNVEEWRAAHPDADASSFKFSYKKMNPAGSLFDYMKLRDVSKNVISKMPADKVYDLLLAWAKEYDAPFAETLASEKDKATAFLSIGRGGKKPRKDIAVWSEVKDYMGYLFTAPEAYEDLSDVRGTDKATDILSAYAAVYDPTDDNNAWFEKVKSVAGQFGFCTDMKEYRNNPDAYPGSTADVSTLIRVAVTGKKNTPDLSTIMSLIGKDECIRRLKNFA